MNVSSTIVIFLSRENKDKSYMTASNGVIDFFFPAHTEKLFLYRPCKIYIIYINISMSDVYYFTLCLQVTACKWKVKSMLLCEMEMHAGENISCVLKINFLNEDP